MTMRPIFVETQRWLQNPVITVAFALMAAIFLAMWYWQTSGGLPTWALLLILAFEISFLYAPTRISVHQDHITIVMAPFIWGKKIEFSSIKKVAAAEFHPIRDYGGWGLKGSWKEKGMSYTVSGRKGVRIDLDGRHILLGSQNPEPLADALNAARSYSTE